MHTYLPILFCSFTAWLIAVLAIQFLKNYLHSKEKQNQLVSNLAKIISKDVISVDSLQAKLSNPAIIERMKPLIEEHVDIFLKDKIAEAFPLISKFIGDKTRQQFKSAFMTEIETLFPTLLNHYMAGLQNDLNLEVMITENFAAIPKEKLDKVILSTLSKKLIAFQLIAVIIGAAIGGLQLFLEGLGTRY